MLLVPALDDPDLMTGGAAHRHGAVDRSTLGLIFVALNALGGVGIRLQWHGMFSGPSRNTCQNHDCC